MSAQIAFNPRQFRYQSVGQPLLDTITGIEKQKRQEGLDADLRARQEASDLRAIEELGLKKDKEARDILEAQTRQKHQRNMQTLAEQRLDILKATKDDAERGRKYTRDVARGNVLGGSFVPDRTQITGTTDTLDKEAYEALQQKIQGREFVPETDDQRQVAYENYLKENDPKAYEDYTKKKGVFERLGLESYSESPLSEYHKDTAGQSMGDRAKGIYNQVFAPESQKDIDTAKPTAEEKTLSRSQFLTKRRKERESEFKSDMTKSLKTLADPEYQKARGLMKPTDVETKVSKEDMMIQADNFIKEYQAKNPDVSRDVLLGMRDRAATTIDTVMNERAAASKAKLKVIVDKLDAAQKHQYKKEELILKDKLGRKPTPTELAELAKTVAQTKKIERETEEL